MDMEDEGGLQLLVQVVLGVDRMLTTRMKFRCHGSRRQSLKRPMQRINQSSWTSVAIASCHLFSQSWLVSEIMSNAASSINVMTERDQVMPPNSGFHVALFGNYTLDGIKVVIAVSIESNTGNPCAGFWQTQAML